MPSHAEEMTKKWWDTNAKQFQRTQFTKIGEVSYNQCAPTESELKLLGNVTGKRVLDLGCGDGHNSITLAKKGARVTGLDISNKQLEFARKLAYTKNVKINFVRKSAQRLNGIGSNGFDIVLSTYVLHYVPDLRLCFSEVSRVLKRNGIFVFSFNHPFYSILDKNTHKLREPYAEVSSIQNVSGKLVIHGMGKLTRFRRRISYIIDSLIHGGFIIERIVEEVDLKKYKKLYTNKAWRAAWGAEYPPKLVKLVPPTLIVKARKIR